MLKIINVIGFLFLFVFAGFAQNSYTYSAESFEDNVWSNMPESYNEVNSSTGTWTVRKNNIQTQEVNAQDGDYCLLIAEKREALMTPRLDNGAGILTYWIIKTGSRTITVETTTDQETWTTVETFKAEDSWVERTVTIDDADVRYIRFSSNSNKGLYLDNILITNAGATGVTVVTDSATQITQTSAIVGGTITEGNGSAIISSGICYNDTGYPDTTSNKIEVSSTTDQFFITLSGLEMGTTYYVKAYAQTASDISYGLVVPFTTREPDAPLAYWIQAFDDLTQFPESQPTSPETINVEGQGEWIYLNAYKSSNALYITDGSAYALRLLKNGSYVITPVLDAGVTELTFTEGRGERELTVYTSTDSGSWSTFQTFETVKGEEISLQIDTAAVNRLKIANNSGSDADIDNITVTVFPSGDVPVLTTTEVTNIGKNTATTGGTISSEGSYSVEKRGVCWSTVTTPIIADSVTSDGDGSGSFTSTISDLPAGTLIHLRAYATSKAGTGYGNEITFTTVDPTIPVIITTVATEVKGELATSGGEITDGGGANITERGVCWNITGTPTIDDSRSDNGTGTGSFESTLINLNTNTTYFYRAYATNIAGTGYGEVYSLTTGDVALPAVTTSEISSVYYYKAIGGGELTDDGDAMTVCGLCWNNTGSPTIADDTINCGTEEGTFTGIMEGLTQNMQYYVRAFATNSVGTAYGDQITFATPVSTVLSEPIGYGEGTTGGGTATGDNTVIVTNAEELIAALNSDKSVILVKDTIITSQIKTTLTNKSIIGLSGARLINLDETKSGSGILYLTEGSRNVIIQNLIFEGPGAYDVDGGDLITNKGCNKLWVDHCEFQDGLDGNFDNTLTSDSITVSWCKFTYLKDPISGGSGGSDDHRFSNLVGGSDSDYPDDGHYSITWQNCWWTDGCVSRMIRGRNTEVHMLNCYWNSPDTKECIKLTAGVNGSTMYVEGGVFDVTGDVSDIGSGSISINFVDCVDGGTNIGTVSQPAYEYIPMSSDEVISEVTSDCGAGATLWVTETGEVYSGCPSIPILTYLGSLQQEVYTGNAIDTIIFIWGGTATDVTISDLLSGLTYQKDESAQTVTISGTPTESGTFTVSTVGGIGLPATKEVTVTLTSEEPATLTYTENTSQTVSSGTAIEDIVFTWGGGATDVTVSGLSKGLDTIKDESNKTLTISGIPTSVSTYTVTTVGGSGDSITVEGTISILYTDKKYKIAYVTNSSESTYANDIKILPALKNDSNFEVTEVSASVSGNDYSSYDLVLLSEVASSTDPGIAELEGIDKPFIMMKVHAYKNESGAWQWLSSSSDYGQDDTETNIEVSDKTHFIFNDV